MGSVHNRLFAGKALATVTAGTCSLLGFITGEAITHQWGSAGLAGILAGGFGALCILIPKFMEQRRKNMETFSEYAKSNHGAHRADGRPARQREFILQIAGSRIESGRDPGARGKSGHHRRGDGRPKSQPILSDQIRRLGHEPLVELHPVDYHAISGAVDKQIKEIKIKALQVARENIPYLQWPLM